MDPLAEKFVHTNPYTYCLNAPIRCTDPDGMDVWDTINAAKQKTDARNASEARSAEAENWVQSSKPTSGKHIGVGVQTENGQKIVTFSFTAAIIDQSSKKYTKAQLEDYQIRIAKGLINSFSGVADGIIYRADVKLRIVNSMYEVASSDHVIHIVDNDKMPLDDVEFIDDITLGYAQTGQNFIYLSTYILDQVTSNDETKTSLERTVAHEFGHSAGLSHFDAEGIPGDLMHQSGNELTGKTLNSNSINKIINLFNTGELNHGKLVQKKSKY